ncbi:MAG: PEP/pyruvate-binding domain-containing protein [Terriglobia bacterium]|nr:PEP/pyruvate-binding domain-containing protein [Terriglobia bacterium]
MGQKTAAVFQKADGTVSALECLSGLSFSQLHQSLQVQRNEVERYVAAREELIPPDFSHRMDEVQGTDIAEAGGKAAALGEIRNKLHLPVPDGFVLTAEAYRQFCGTPLWEKIRDATHNLDLNDLAALQRISAQLTAMVMELPVPRAIEVAIIERARALQGSAGLAVRSSAVGEGGERTFAGQFVSLLNVPPHQLIDAYKRVVAGRFSERALFYRLSAGLSEIETALPVLFLNTLRARASGILYSRDPADPKSNVLWITATHGLGLDIASGRVPADLFVVTRRRPHHIVEQSVAAKEEEIVLLETGGHARRPLPSTQVTAPSLTPTEVETLAAWAVQLEEHFKTPQDVEWVLDDAGKLWIVQSRTLALATAASIKAKSRIKQEPLLAGGRTVYPGRVSGTAYLVSEPRLLQTTPEGAILFVRRASPEIVEVFPRIAGLVAESGNVTGHAAALLREAKIPAIFQLNGVFEKIHAGDPVSLDAVQPRVYAGNLWPSRTIEVSGSDRRWKNPVDPISERLLTLHLLDPAAADFRPSGCKSAHDVLRFCHEKAIGIMFEVGDIELESGSRRTSRRLLTPVPVNLHVLDLGGGLASTNGSTEEVRPEEIVSRPFQALWRGMSRPDVSWRREIPASFGDLASVISNALTAVHGPTRALGDMSYLLVADEYMNLNSRLAYHFSLVDACLSDVPSHNYISFRFAGGGAVHYRRNLRACFIEACLAHYGFVVDRRADLVNAWFKKAPAEETEANLDILGRLMASASQLDMYMTSDAVMRWFVEQFLQGNYTFAATKQDASQSTTAGKTEDHR